jgi:hypothetical protein
VDAAGNIYIADTYNYRIRKVTVSTGIISTAAGNGIYGYSGDGGAATGAELNRPGGVKVDAVGNIYIADQYNNRIRAVGSSSELANFDDITTGWQLCEGSCAGGNNPTQVTQTFGISPPSIDGTSMKLLLSGPSGANNGWYYNTGAKDTATSFTLDMEFNIPSTTYVQALEFDQFQYLHAGSGGVSANTRLYIGTECITGSIWKVWDSSGVGWVNVPGATCSYTVSPTAFNHLTIATHRVTGDTSCTGGYPCMYYDSITLNGKVVVSNIKTNAGGLPVGWGEQTGFMIQLDTNSTCGSACTIQEYVDKGNISIY